MVASKNTGGISNANILLNHSYKPDDLLLYDNHGQLVLKAHFYNNSVGVIVDYPSPKELGLLQYKIYGKSDGKLVTYMNVFSVEEPQFIYLENNKIRPSTTIYDFELSKAGVDFLNTFSKNVISVKLQTELKLNGISLFTDYIKTGRSRVKTKNMVKITESLETQIVNPELQEALTPLERMDWDIILTTFNSETQEEISTSILQRTTTIVKK